MKTRRPPLAFVILGSIGLALVVVPLLGLVVRAPWGDAATHLGSGRTMDALRVSLVVSVAATAFAVTVGFPLAWLLARVEFRGRAVVRALVLLPLVLPPVVGGIGLLSAFGRRGLLGGALDVLGVQLPFSLAGAVLAATFVSFPLFVIAAEAGLRSLDSRLEVAGEVLGGSRGYVLRRVTIPMIAPSLVAGVALTWARALGEFGATITFAGNLRGSTQTLSLAVFESGQTDSGTAIMLSLLLVVLSLGALIGLRGRLPGAAG